MVDQPPALEVTDEELLEAIHQQCEIKGVPVVKTSHVADVDFITIQQQSVHDRLERLHDEGRVGRMQVSTGSVWWIPDDETDNIVFDPTNIEWDSIDGEDIPIEKIEEHPDYRSLSRWEQWQADARSGIRWIGFAILFGSLFRAIPDTEIVQLPPSQQQLLDSLGVILTLIGITLGIVALLMWIFGTLLQALDEKGVFDRGRQYWRRGVRALKEKSPYWITIE